MSLSSRGCRANIDGIIKTADNKIIAIIQCYTSYVKNGEVKLSRDYKGRVCLMNPNNETLYHGDMIKIKGFYIKNCNGRLQHKFDTIVITDWEIFIRNRFNKKYYKRPTETEVLEEKRKQRQAIEEEIEAEEQDIDEYIDNNGEDSIPF